MTIEFPFEIGQAIWTHTMIDEEWANANHEKAVSALTGE